MTAATNEDSIGCFFEIFFDMEEIKLLIAKDLNLLSGIFLMVELSRIFPHPQCSLIPRNGEQSTHCGFNSFVTFLLRREMPGI